MATVCKMFRNLGNRHALGLAGFFATFAILSMPFMTMSEANANSGVPRSYSAPPVPVQDYAPHRKSTSNLNGIAPAARYPSAETKRLPVGTTLNESLIPHAESTSTLTRLSQTSAEKFVRQLAAEALKVRRNATLSEQQRDTQLRNLMRKGLNLRLMGKFALGRFWGTADATMMHEYQKLFGDFVIATYSKHFGRRKVKSISFLGARNAGRKDVVVHTRFDLAMGIGIPANWRVRLIAGRPQIIDVEVAGISMAMTYRNEFIAFMERNGGHLGDLVSRLRKRST